MTSAMPTALCPGWVQLQAISGGLHFWLCGRRPKQDLLNRQAERFGVQRHNFQIRLAAALIAGNRRLVASDDLGKLALSKALAFPCFAEVLAHGDEYVPSA